MPGSPLARARAAVSSASSNSSTSARSPSGTDRRSGSVRARSTIVRAGLVTRRPDTVRISSSSSGVGCRWAWDRIFPPPRAGAIGSDAPGSASRSRAGDRGSPRPSDDSPPHPARSFGPSPRPAEDEPAEQSAVRSAESRTRHVGCDPTTRPWSIEPIRHGESRARPTRGPDRSCAWTRANPFDPVPPPTGSNLWITVLSVLQTRSTPTPLAQHPHPRSPTPNPGHAPRTRPALPLQEERGTTTGSAATPRSTAATAAAEPIRLGVTEASRTPPGLPPTTLMLLVLPPCSHCRRSAARR